MCYLLRSSRGDEKLERLAGLTSNTDESESGMASKYLMISISNVMSDEKPSNEISVLWGLNSEWASNTIS